MNDKSTIFYKLDILSSAPQLRIYGNNNYKTTFGVILSIIALLGALSFVLYSFLDYLQFNAPSIVYWKDSYQDERRTINVNESLMMFQLLDTSNNLIDLTDAKLLAELVEFENSKGETSIQNVTLEKCKLGTNIDQKFRDTLETFKQNTGEDISNYYCIEAKKNITLFYYPKSGYNYLRISVIIESGSEYSPSNIKAHYVIQEDFVRHFNKSYPIAHQQSTGYTSSYAEDKYTISTFSMEYLEYESDNGIIFETIVKEKGFMLGSVSTELTSKDDYAYDFENDLLNHGYSKIGDIRIQVTQKNSYERYKRTYPKIQSILADVKTMIDVILIVSGIITNLISNKKMSVDLVRSLLSKKTNIEKYYATFKQSKEFYEKFKDQNSHHYIYDYNKTKNSSIIKDTSKNTSYMVKDLDLVKSIIARNKEINVKNERNAKKIGVCTIIKSYFCCEDPKTKFINASHDIISEIFCIDQLLDRILKFEKMYDILNDEDKYKILFMDSRELKNVNDCLKNIDPGEISISTEVKDNKNKSIIVNELSKSESEKV